MLKTLQSIVIGFALLIGSGITQANLISNGGFESGSFSGWGTSGLTCSGVGSTFSVATGGCVGMVSDPGPYSGNYAAYLGTALGGGVISQAFATTPGQTYLVDFFLANGSYNGSSTPNDFLVEWDTGTLMHLVGAASQGFTEYAFYVVAASASSTLKFTHQQTPSFWVLDNVSVVPEPSVVALLGLGLAALGFSRRKQ